MTRLASILGVATVATLVLLSGCEAAVTTDHVEDLEGTWTIADLPTMVEFDLDGPGPGPAVTAPAKTSVQVTISAGDKLNTGDFTVVVTHVVTGVPPAVSTLPPVTATGTIMVDSKTIDVTVGEISAPMVDLPAPVQAFEGQTIEIGYTVTDDTLVITSTLLVALQVADPADPQLTLTKSATE